MLTISNTGRAIGIALGGALFSGILASQYHINLAQDMDYSQWSVNPSPYVTAFKQSYLVTSGLTFLAIIFSAIRGKKKKLAS